MTKFQSRKKIYLLVLILLLIAGAITGIKIYFLHFSFFRDNNTELWIMESKITFDANGGPVKATLNIPSELHGYYLAATSKTPDFDFRAQDSDGILKAQWVSPECAGNQILLCQITFIPDKTAKEPPDEFPEIPPSPHWEKGQKALAEQIVNGIDPLRKLSRKQFTQALLKTLHKNDHPAATILLAEKRTGISFLHTVEKLLAMRGIPSRIVEGVYLTDRRRKQAITAKLEVFYDQKYHRFDPYTGLPAKESGFVPLRQGGAPMLELTGGRHVKIQFSVLKTNISAAGLNSLRGNLLKHSWVMNIAGYELPIEEQNVFKRLAMLPLAVLLIVIVRNIIGLQSMGTFMPVLIALAFLETGLIPGLIAFLLILSVGLLARSLLANMNLLLVPRISAVVVIVIILMKIITVLSYTFGFQEGQSITFFPLIIIAWTIERASMVWEEDGARTMLRQLTVSLAACIPCYFLMNSDYLQYLFFSFQELNLVILSGILLLGTYTGYRLTELKRFQSLVKPCSDPS